MLRLREIPCRMLARTAVQPRVLVALIIQCATMATEVVEVAEVATESCRKTANCTPRNHYGTTRYTP